MDIQDGSAIMELIIIIERKTNSGGKKKNNCTRMLQLEIILQY